MKRLTPKDWKEIENHCYAKGLYFSNQFTEEESDKMIKRLAELEDKLESGQLVELPCIIEVQDLDSVRYDIYFKRTEPPYKGSLDFYVRKTREEAEARLKELLSK